jgi:hypothetical protein
MNSDDRLERVLPDVLARSAPPRAPDQLRHEILSTASRTRQRPARLVSLVSLLRYEPMTPLLRIAAAAVLAFAVGIAVVPHSEPGAPASAPSLSASPSPAVTPAALPVAGPIEAGTYRARAFRPRMDGALRAGQLQLTLPDGWVAASDTTSEMKLEPAGAAELAVGDRWPDQLRVWARPAAITSEDGCSPAEAPSVGRSYDDLLAFVLEHPGLTIENDSEVTVGGYPGHVVDIAIAPTWTLRCPEVPGAGPVVPLFAEVNPFELDGAIGAGWAWGAGGYTGMDQDLVRLMLVDLGGGDVVIVAVDSMLPEGQAALVEAAMPIIESFSFPD